MIKYSLERREEGTVIHVWGLNASVYWGGFHKYSVEIAEEDFQGLRNWLEGHRTESLWPRERLLSAFRRRL